MNSIIHIGYPKTASTWFKSNLYPYVKNGHIIDDKVIVNEIIAPHVFEFNKDIFARKIADANSKETIICSSMLMGGLIMSGNNGVYTKEIASRLKQISPESQIILFIRKQTDIIASAYAEYIKGGGTYKIDKYLHREINIPLGFSFNYFKYDETIKLYRNLFGDENVKVFLFEDLRQSPKVFIEKYCKILDIDIELDRVNFSKENEAYKKWVLYLVRFINKFTRKGVYYKKWIIDLPYPREFVKKIFGKINTCKMAGRKLSPEEILGKKWTDYINEYYKESNRRLISECGIDSINKFNYPL